MIVYMLELRYSRGRLGNFVVVNMSEPPVGTDKKDMQKRRESRPSKRSELRDYGRVTGLTCSTLYQKSLKICFQNAIETISG